MSKFLKNIFRYYKKIQPYSHVLKEKWWSLKYLRPRRSKCRDRIGVMMIDGRGYHGGMTDRFKGAISWWHYCQKNNLDYRIHYVYPFKLTDYVVPNEYDWTIEEKDIPAGLFDTRIFYGRGEWGKRLEKVKTKKHIWYYGNLDLGISLGYPYNQDWGITFKKLFKPSYLVEKHLAALREKIGDNYVAAVFRFQNLLGDFNEPHYRKINNETEKRRLIEKAVEQLDIIHTENPDSRVLVTSDSINFLNEVSKLHFVRIIPGEIVHMDFTDADHQHTQLKSFLDFFMISEARKVYSVVIGDMYPSDFPVYAAKINNAPFERITIEL